jgi:hypothetical protein
MVVGAFDIQSLLKSSFQSVLFIISVCTAISSFEVRFHRVGSKIKVWAGPGLVLFEKTPFHVKERGVSRAGRHGMEFFGGVSKDSILA